MNLKTIVERFRALPLYGQLWIGGVVTGLSFPPFHLGFLAWVGLVPLIIAWRDVQEPWRAAVLAWHWSLGFLLVILYWIMFNTGTYFWAATISMFGTVLIISVNFLIIGGWYGWLKRRWGARTIWLLPSIWVAVEFVRSYGSVGFPWVILANSQTNFLLLMQHAEITGVYGISFWIILLNILVVELIYAAEKRQYGGILAVVFLIPWLTGSLLLPVPVEPTYRVAMVQPNVDANEKWEPERRNEVFAQLDELSRQVAVDSPAVIFWPEAATPAYLKRGGRRYLEDIRGLISDIGIPIVTGLPHYERIDRDHVNYYNSAGFIDSTGITKIYNKVQLVPFAESIPPIFKWLNIIDMLGVNLGEFVAGEEYTVFEAGGARFSTGICLETTYPEVYRQFAKAGAQYLVGLSNDGWYNHGIETEPYQHAEQLRYRAIETRRPAVRAGNTGITMTVDKGGRVTNRLPLNEEGVMSALIAPTDGETFYMRYGDLFAWINLILGITFLAFVIWESKMKKVSKKSMETESE